MQILSAVFQGIEIRVDPGRLSRIQKILKKVGILEPTET